MKPTGRLVDDEFDFSLSLKEEEGDENNLVYLTNILQMGYIHEMFELHLGLSEAFFDQGLSDRLALVCQEPTCLVLSYGRRG